VSTDLVFGQEWSLSPHQSVADLDHGVIAGVDELKPVLDRMKQRSVISASPDCQRCGTTMGHDSMAERTVDMTGYQHMAVLPILQLCWQRHIEYL
jgi:hypothetical protein